MIGARWLRRRVRQRQAKGLVLCYHRVAVLEHDPQLLAVTPDRFSEQLEFLRASCSLVPLADIVDGREGDTPRLEVTITFDDGYADNLISALPLLEQYECPATVFVCTGNLGSKREFWWDELERIFLTGSSLPSQLDVTIDGTTFASPVEPPGPVEPRWNILSPSDPSSRHSLYRRLATALRPLQPRERDRITAELRTWASLPEDGRPTHRSLSPDEAVAIASSALVEVGAHTVGHPVLARLAAAEQDAEIAGSRDTLQEIIRRPVDSFAYPYGSADDYEDRTVAILEQQGFRRACTTASEPVPRKADPFRIPRLLVRDWNRSEFAARLAPFLPG